MKIIVGNLLVGLLAWGWIMFAMPDKRMAIAGVLAIATASILGVLIGWWICVSAAKGAFKRSRPSTKIDPTVFDRIE